MNNENKDIINENDTYVEDRIRSSEVEIPESLRPDNIEQKLAAITHEEFERRSRSEDVPFEKSENTVVSIEKKRKKNRAGRLGEDAFHIRLAQRPAGVAVDLLDELR
ncbi:MAG: hypothetical protein IKH94_01060, partial [Eubacterium sp.]|nr:hypothetical protein [Eubacterium sp.]